MRAVLNGYRVVFEERALAFDKASTTARAESRRKTRTLAGNYQILGQEPRLLVPITNPVWLQYVSHKVGRLLVPWALLLAFVSNIFAGDDEVVLRRGTNRAGRFYGLALVGGLAEMRGSRRSRRVREDVNAAGKGSTVNGSLHKHSESGVHLRDDELRCGCRLVALRRGREVWR